MKKPKLIFRKKYKSSAAAVRSYARRHRAAGLCLYCSNRPDINPRTGKLYLLCQYHLKRVAGRQKLIMRKRRAHVGLTKAVGKRLIYKTAND